MVKTNILLKLTDFQAVALDCLSNKTGIDYTNLIRQGIYEKIERDLTPQEKKKVIEICEDMIQEINENINYWHREFERMNQEEKRIYHNVLLKALSQRKKKNPFKEIEKIDGWNKLNPIAQERIFDIISSWIRWDNIPDDTPDKLVWLIEHPNEEKREQSLIKYFDKVIQRRYQTDLTELQKLRNYEDGFDFMTDRERALSLMYENQELKDKIKKMNGEKNDKDENKKTE